MAAHRAVLILALVAGIVCAPAGAHAGARSPGPGCASCHETNHYPTLGTCTGCHRGNAAARREALAHDHLLRGAAAAWSIPGVGAVRDGERLRDALGCRRCHVTGGRGNPLAISLDAAVWRRDQEALRASIQHPATFMPDFGLSTAQADRLIAVLLRDGDRQGRQERYMVRFRGGAATPGNAFVVRCGGCHRALTPLGPLGVGSAGPNLSGLLTEHYPSPDGRRWTRERLERWVANPRAERAITTMHPVEASRPELAQIESLLGATPVR
jgi:cytochrome c2